MSKINIFSIIMVILATNAINGASKSPSDFQGDNLMTAKTIQKVLKENNIRLLSIQGVAGTAQGLCNNQPCIKVFVTRKTPELEKKIPVILDGYPVVIETTGEFRKLPRNQK
jgi:hypothetical protein